MEESAAERNVAPERARGLGKALIQQEQRGPATARSSPMSKWWLMSFRASTFWYYV